MKDYGLNSLPVNLIRQWSYCPRVVYYMELIKASFHRPGWLKQGTDFHQAEKKLWQRRNLSRFHLKTGKTHYNLSLRDPVLGLHGIVDMAIETKTEVYPVEFKLSANKRKQGDQLQLVAYAMLLEKHFSKPSPVGFLSGKGKALWTINIDADKRKSVRGVSANIRKMLKQGLKPPSSASYAQCCICEYVNFCNDRF